MSECVVRMEMPESCEKCPVCDYEEGNCLLADDRNTLPHNGKRKSWCPILCQLPEGHGRLVDAEEDVSNYITVWDCNCSEFGRQTVMAVEDLQYLPTIVPAERSET